MAARKPRAARPVDAALNRLLALAGRGVSPNRMAREVDAIVAEWQQGAAGDDGADVKDQLDELREQLTAGVAAAEEAVSDVDASDAGAVKQARHMLAALVATRDAADGALATAGSPATCSRCRRPSASTSCSAPCSPTTSPTRRWCASCAGSRRAPAAAG